MKKVVIDTNLWISFLISKRTTKLIDVLMRDDICVYLSPELVKEFTDVARRPKLAKYFNQAKVLRLSQLIRDKCVICPIVIDSNLDVRDPKDHYLLSLCESIGADYLVSGDKDLHAVDTHGRFEVVSFHDFTDRLGI